MPREPAVVLEAQAGVRSLVAEVPCSCSEVGVSNSFAAEHGLGWRPPVISEWRAGSAADSAAR